MRPKQSLKENVRRQPNLSKALGASRDLLSALFQSSAVGVAICDRQFRFRAINDALASMNGFPASAHLGKTLHAVLGDAAAKIQPAFEHVFATGQPLSNFEVIAELPGRGETGHWNENYFPIKNEKGRVEHVGAIVLELTKRQEIDAALVHLMENLTSMGSSFAESYGALGPAGLDQAHAGLGDLFARSLRLLENCVSQARTISQLLNAAPSLAAVRPSNHSRLKATRLRADLESIGTPPDGVNPLSEREREVIALLANGRTNKEIAKLLTISTRTVESHRSRIMLKLDLRSLSELVRYALRSDIIRA